MKQKRGCLWIFVVLALVVGIAIYNSGDKEEPAVEEQKQEEQVVPEEKEVAPAPIPEDEYLTEEDLPLAKSSMEQAYDIAKPYVDDAFGDVDYTLSIEGNCILLIIDASQAEVVYMVSSNQWNGVVEDAKEASKNMCTIFQQNGINDAHFSIMLGDVSADEAFLVTLDGVVMVDIPNGINKLS